MDFKHNPKYALKDSYMGDGRYQSMTADLPFFSMYGLKVRLGYPRTVKVLSTRPNSLLSLVEDSHTGQWFLAHRDQGLVQYCKEDSSYFKK